MKANYNQLNDETLIAPCPNHIKCVLNYKKKKKATNFPSIKNLLKQLTFGCVLVILIDIRHEEEVYYHLKKKKKVTLTHLKGQQISAIS